MTDWKFNDRELKKILARHNDPSDEGTSVASTVIELLPHLATNPCYARLQKAVTEKMRKATTFHTLNQALDLIYDYADDNRIWLGFMPSCGGKGDDDRNQPGVGEVNG